ncbi:MAG: hypothetical protein F4137_25625 [Acidobacteria bacterium]|nr:hypothetical protein [Acidobacteriota bacterium]
MSVSLRGQQQWEGFHVLCKGPEVAGVDRRLFGLLGIAFFVMWQLLESFLLGVVMAGGLLVVFRRLTVYDPHWFEILRVTSRYDVAWCDPGGVPARFGECVLDVPLDSLGDDRAGGKAEGAR